MAKDLPAFIFALVFSIHQSPAQDPSGNLILSGWTASGGILGMVNYPSGNWIFIDSISATDLDFENGTLLASHDGKLAAYDINTLMKTDSLSGAGISGIEISNGRLWAICDSAPFVRVFDAGNQFSGLLTLDSATIPQIPADMKIYGAKVYLAWDTTVVVADQISGNVLAVVPTPLEWPGAGANSWLTPFQDMIVLDAEYSTGVPRFDLSRIDTTSLQCTHIQLVEYYYNFTPPVAANQVVYYSGFDNHYEPVADTFNISADTTVFHAAASDPVSGAVFFGDQSVNLIQYRRSDSTISAGDSIPFPWANQLIRALFIPDSIIQKAEKLSNNQFKTYPNPAAEFLNLETPLSGFAELYSPEGKLMFKANVNAGLTIFPLTGLSGINFLRFHCNSGTLFTRTIHILGP